MNLLENMFNGAGEGNISWFYERIELLTEITTKSNPQILLEIGFNMGHSSKLICDILMNKEEKINRTFYIFDICSHDYTEPNFEIMKNYYKDYNIDLILIKGSSLDTLEKTINELNIKDIDFANIDGLHTPEGVTSDFNNLKDLIKENGIIYIDDYNSIVAPEVELSKAIDKLDWSTFEVNSIRGVMYGKKIKK